MITFIPANIKFWILVVIMCGLGALQKLVQLEPTWDWITEVIQVLSFLEAFFTVPTNPAKRLGSGPAKAAGLLFGYLAFRSLSACAPGEIFGPTSNIPSDLTSDAECIAGQLIAGNLDPVSVFAKCQLTETQTIDDLWTFVVDAVEGSGAAGTKSISPAQASAARDNLQAHRAGKAKP